MNKFTITAFALASLLLASGFANAEDAKPPVQKSPSVKNWCAGRDKSTCSADVACVWRETIRSTGPVETDCRYSATVAKTIIAKFVK